ncbi:uncharacterized protein N7459_000508 [Penicillium hispanicum]|uniref:uncharacterized protein n=1 Tax=Penicillium hispanicum TaxID=1080232 RepID=UPI0025408310|nr:uncharacterized protein N7459_000508 [Penicillium hispanicum]KAJ5594300.1 hypothetical protein N7459_000508 [Penicillium hispanicum]
MASSLKNVAIVGASGSIGSIILNSLIASSKFTITVVTRKESEAVFPSNVTVVKSDYSEADLETAFKGKDAVISAVGALGFGEQKKFVDAAIRAGVKRFIPSEFSSSWEDEAVLQLLPLFGVKKELVGYLKSKESEGLTWTGIATSGLFDWGLGNGFLEFNIADRTATIWDGGRKSFTLTNEETLGQSVISVLEHPQETSNRYLYVASVETTQQDILVALENATGAKWTVNETTTDSQVEEGQKKLQAGDFGGALILVRATVFSNTPGLRANYIKEEQFANSLLGLKIESIEDTVKRVVGK